MPSAATLMRAAVVAGVASALPELAPRQMVTSDCADVHIFLGKGNNEPYPGRQGKLVTAICSGLSSCDYEDIQMQNMLEDEYCGAVTQGTTNGKAQIIAYNKRCPNSKLVVSGYSQGAQVVGDIFSGAGATIFNGCVEPVIPALDITSDAGRMIAAITTFGDVRHTAYQPYNYQDGATKWGLYPRSSDQLAKAINFAGVWRDYCHGADPICAGGDSTPEHLNYFDVDTDAAAAFVHDRLSAFVGPKNTAKPTSAKPTSAAPTVTTTRSPFGNATMTSAAPSSTVVTVTDESGVVTSYTTACPVTQSYIENPHTVTPPADHSLTATVKSPLPEATCQTTENLSAIPVTAAATGPAGPAGTTPAGNSGGPGKPTPTGPATAGAVANAAGFFGLVAFAAVAALL